MEIPKEILEYTKAFRKEFAEFFTHPRTDHFPEEEQGRIVMLEDHIVLPAATKFSDWDMYCYVDETVVGIPELERMRNFVMTWKDFELMRDYVTRAHHHFQAHAYQSVGEEGRRVYAIQCMGVIKNRDVAPFLDIHIIGASKPIMNSFYNSLNGYNETGYMDWSMLTYWRKIRRKNSDPHEDMETTVWTRSILPGLTDEEQAQANADPIEFFRAYFKNRPEFRRVVDMLDSQV